jgi:SAM-dependent methyltransferase
VEKTALPSTPFKTESSEAAFNSALPEEMITILDDPNLLRNFLRSSQVGSQPTEQWASVHRVLAQWAESIYNGGMGQLLYYLNEYDMFQDTKDIVYHDILEKLCLDGSSRFLDAGCGAGQLLLAAGEHSPLMSVGIDLDPIGLVLARYLLTQSGATTTLRQGSVAALPFEDGQFSAIACRSVLMYVDSEEAMRELARCLQIGGRLYLKVHPPRYYMSKILDGLRAGKAKLAIYHMMVLANSVLSVLSPGLTVKLGRTKGYKESPITFPWMRRSAALNGLQILEHEFCCTGINTPDVLLMKISTPEK